ncbi:MAG: aminotransferase class V-fold PLP-dependent enzyme [Limnoraphis sp. WC205]|jgi:glutamate/tyrosine decarboxylase-like PLP-dependent enzyme|nr:aminotransferase class V-fold PLP-dependent enzyme [Limnoraphis sp. WC205]
MNLSELPLTAFIDPQGKNRQEIEQLASQILDLILSHLATAVDHSPLPEIGDLTDFISIPETSTPESVLLEKLNTIIKSSTNAANPGYMGHMDSMPTTISILAELVAAALNNNMLSVEMSPVFSRLEFHLIKQFAQRFGLGQTSGGVMASGGTLANLQALTVARNRVFDSQKSGIWNQTQQPVLFASEVAHTSLQKAAMLLGLGTSAVIPVQTNINSKIEIEDLKFKIEQAKLAGKIPFCIVATAGTTTTGNIDPLEPMAEIARQHHLWFHVDAAYGGAIIFSPQYCQKLNGIEQADSITFNPQKWLYVARTCAMVLFREFQQLETEFRISAPYMQTVEDVINLGEITIQGTRHADVLKLWLSLQHLGKKGYAQLINESYQLTDYLFQELAKIQDLEVVSQPDTNIICFRSIPANILPEDQDQWNADLQAYLLQNANIFLSLPLYRGQRWLRIILLNPYINQTQLDHLIQQINTFTRVRLTHS